MKWIYYKQFGDVAVLDSLRGASLQNLAVEVLNLAKEMAEEQYEYPAWGYTGSPWEDDPDGTLVGHETKLYIMFGEGGGIYQVSAEYDKKMNMQSTSLIYVSDNGNTDNDDIHDVYMPVLEYEFGRNEQTKNIYFE